MKIGDLVINSNAWQGEILEISPSARFGVQVLVQYASQSQWENQAELVVAASAPEREDDALGRCHFCDGDGWGIVGVNWDCEDPINGPYDGETEPCPCCGGTGLEDDAIFW
jgi:hypothetical protein